jgi:aminoglycoside phosphotransferase (APT) family kinase protein
VPVPRRDLDETRGSLRDWLRAKLPRAHDLVVSPLTGPAATGFSSDTLLFDLEYAENGQRRERALVCRAEPTAGFPIFPRHDVAQQYHIMAALKRSTVPVPEMLWLEPDAGVLGSPFFVMERVEGRIPNDNPPYHAAGWVTEIDPAERRALWHAALDALAEIHRQEPGALGVDLADAPSPGTDTAAWQLDHWSRYYDWVAAGQRQPTLDAALAWLRDRCPAPRRSPSLCWGDARIGNMIFRGGRCVAVLDWEMATIAPPEMDLGWFLYMDRHHSEGVGAARLPGFPDQEETIARWERRVGHAACDVAYWEVFAGFRFATIMTRVAQQMIRFAILPADSTFPSDNTASRMLATVLGLPAPGTV